MRNRFLIVVILWVAAATLLSAQPVTYNIRSVAGNYTGLGDNGPAVNAVFINTTTLTVDSAGNIYVAELPGRIRKIGPDGVVTAFAGNPGGTGLGDGGPATQATLNVDLGLATDPSGNLYLSEFQNCRIRRVNPQSGIITTVAGNGTCSFSPDGPISTLNFPGALVLDPQGRLVVVEGSRIRRIDLSAGTITTIAGTGTAGILGNGGPATAAQINAPAALTGDSLGNLFFADTGNCLVRSISVAAGTLQTIAGTTCGSSGDNGPASAAQLNSPAAVVVNSGGHLLYVGETSRIRQINLDTHVITTYAGTGTQGHTGDGGPAVQAQISPGALAFDKNGNLLLLENTQLRRIDSAGNINTIAGVDQSGGDGGPAVFASLSLPNGVASDGKGGFAISDAANARIRKVVADGTITTIAGGATGITLGFIHSGGMAYDASGNLYFAESNFSDPTLNRLRKIDTTGAVSRVSPTNFAIPGGIALDPTQRFLYITEQNGNRVDKVDLTTGVATTFAGQGAPGATVGGGFFGDGGPANQAKLFDPVSVAVDSSGNVYVEDGGNARIRRISPSGDMIQTIAGNGTQAGLQGQPPLSGDGGIATSAAIDAFFGIASDAAGNLFIAEINKIRRVDAASGFITTIAGGATSGFSGDRGPALVAQINAQGVAVDAAGNVLIADTGNNRVRELFDANKMVITYVSTANGPAAIAPNTWIVIKGKNLVPANTAANGVIWSSAPEFAAGRMPVQLGGISAKVNGKPAYIYFFCSLATALSCYSDQINMLTSLDNTTGPVQIVVTNGAVSSPPFTVTAQPLVPSFLQFSFKGYVVATHTDLSLLGPTTLYPNASTPARPLETVIIYGVGFGLPPAPLVEGSSTQSASLQFPVCTVGGLPASVSAAVLVGPGLYAFFVVVPAGAVTGDNPVSCTYQNSATPAGNLLTVQR
jgi:uncharacterized protein (TIGR03437 family)